MSLSQVQALQIALNAQGMDSGPPDGLVGAATQRAVRQYQRSRGLAVDGYPTLELLQRLLSPTATN
jgi:peptidoglycan hydrolase-like protein with peptidoglycan-binding domain